MQHVPLGPGLRRALGVSVANRDQLEAIDLVDCLEMILADSPASNECDAKSLFRAQSGDSPQFVAPAAAPAPARAPGPAPAPAPAHPSAAATAFLPVFRAACFAALRIFVRQPLAALTHPADPSGWNANHQRIS